MCEGDVELDLGGPGVRGFRRCPHAARRASPSDVASRRVSVDTSSGAVRRTFVITGDPCDDPTSPGSTQESERVTSEDRNLDAPDPTTNERALARVFALRRSVPAAGASLRWRRGDGGQRDVEAVTGCRSRRTNPGSVGLRRVVAVLSAVARMSFDFFQDATGDVDQVVTGGVRSVREQADGLLGAAALQ